MDHQPHSPYLSPLDDSSSERHVSFAASLAPSSIYQDDAASIAPLLEHAYTWSEAGQRRPTRVPIYNHETSSEADPDEIVMTAVRIRPMPVKFQSDPSAPVPRRKSLPIINRLRATSLAKPKFRIVLLPRSECMKHFAKNSKGTYVGTEEQRDWTEEELDERYGQYKSLLPMPPLSGLTPRESGRSSTPGYGMF